MNRLLFCLPFLLAWPVLGQNQTAPSQPKRDVTMHVQDVRLPQALAIPLLRQLNSSQEPDRKAAVDTVQKLIADGTATLMAWPIITTHVGSRATYEEVDELRYATEFTQGAYDVFVLDREEQFQFRKKEGAVRGKEYSPMVSAFDTRNIGFSMQFEATLQEDGKMLDVSVVCQRVRLKTVDRLTIEHEYVAEKRTERMTQEQPRFSTTKIESNLLIGSGEHKLLGNGKAPEGDNQMELFILSVDLRD